MTQIPNNQMPTVRLHIVVMNCNGIGVDIANFFSSQGKIVYVIDSEPNHFNQLPKGEIEEGNIIPVIGEGTTQRDLLKSQIQDAEVFIAITEADSQNILASQIAKHIFNVPLVICRVEDAIKKEIYSSLGIQAISATNIITKTILDSALPGSNPDIIG